MELPTELYEWLVSAGALTERDAKSKDSSAVILTPESSQSLEMGLKMPELLKRLQQHNVLSTFLTLG